LLHEFALYGLITVIELKSKVRMEMYWKIKVTSQ